MIATDPLGLGKRSSRLGRWPDLPVRVYVAAVGAKVNDTNLRWVATRGAVHA